MHQLSTLRFLLAALPMVSVMAIPVASATPAATETTTATPAATATTTATAGVEWRSLTFEEAMAEAQETGLPVFVDVWSDHCGQCGTMEEEFWPSEEAAHLTAGTIPIQIRSDDPAANGFRQNYPILGLPAVLLIAPDGSEIDRVTGYYGVNRFLSEAGNILAQVDPLPEMEAELAARPNELGLHLPLLNAYVYRKRTEDAERLLDRVLELDADNSAKQAEKAMIALAKYHGYFTGQAERSQEIWRHFVETFPTASSVGQGMKATFDHAKSQGALEEWKTWVCGVLEENPEVGRFAYSVAIWGNRGGLRGPCLAEAARTAHRQKIGPAWMDSLAIVLEGAPGTRGDR